AHHHSAEFDRSAFLNQTITELIDRIARHILAGNLEKSAFRVASQTPPHSMRHDTRHLIAWKRVHFLSDRTEQSLPKHLFNLMFLSIGHGTFGSAMRMKSVLCTFAISADEDDPATVATIDDDCLFGRLAFLFSSPDPSTGCARQDRRILLVIDCVIGKLQQTWMRSDLFLQIRLHLLF